MPTFFERALLPLAKLGIIDLLVFFLVFLIVYIFLHKSKALGQRATKSMELVIAFATGLMFVNLIPGTVFLQYALWFIIAFVAIIMLLLIMSLFDIEQPKVNYVIGGSLGLVFLLVFSQLITSELVMNLVLGLGVLGFLIVAILVLEGYALLAAAGGNIVLAVMAFSLGFQRSVETVYLNGLTLGLGIFAVLLWYILRGGEVASQHQQAERQQAAAPQAPAQPERAARGEDVRARAPERDIPFPERDFSTEGRFEKEWEKKGEELDEYMDTLGEYSR